MVGAPPNRLRDAAYDLVVLDATSPDLADPPDSTEESADEPSEDSPGTEPDPAPVEPTSMARSAMNVLSTTDGDTPVTYPVNLPDG